MSLELTSLRCSACGNKWRGLWDLQIPEQCEPAKRCPACGKEAAQSLQSIELFPENAFSVQLVEGDLHCILPAGESASFRLRAVFPRFYAMNFAAWLVRFADPEGKDFEWLLEEIKRKQGLVTTNQH